MQILMDFTPGHCHTMHKFSHSNVPKRLNQQQKKDEALTELSSLKMSLSRLWSQTVWKLLVPQNVNEDEVFTYFSAMWCTDKQTQFVSDNRKQHFTPTLFDVSSALLVEELLFYLFMCVSSSVSLIFLTYLHPSYGVDAPALDFLLGFGATNLPLWNGSPSSHCSKKWPWKDAKYHGNILSHYLFPCQSVAANSKLEPSTTLLTLTVLAYLANTKYLHLRIQEKLFEMKI